VPPVHGVSTTPLTTAELPSGRARLPERRSGTPIRRARICPAGWRPWDRADLPFADTPRIPSIRRPNLCRAAAQPVAVAANGRPLAASFSVRRLTAGATKAAMAPLK
jgi:hypothetical protein